MLIISRDHRPCLILYTTKQPMYRWSLADDWNMVTVSSIVTRGFYWRKQYCPRIKFKVLSHNIVLLGWLVIHMTLIYHTYTLNREYLSLEKDIVSISSLMRYGCFTWPQLWYHINTMFTNLRIGSTISMVLGPILCFLDWVRGCSFLYLTYTHMCFLYGNMSFIMCLNMNSYFWAITFNVDKICYS
jgi:hypothetical protein